MSIRTNSHPTAAELTQQVSAYYTPNLPKIKASEVLAEIEKRCAEGQQYTTFPNTITESEKALVEAEGYIITENTVHGENRNGAPDMYIGFQVAMTEKATDNAMVISEAETNGIEGGGGSDIDIPDGAVLLGVGGTENNEGG